MSSEDNFLKNDNKKEEKIYYNINNIDENDDNINNIDDDEINLPTKEDILFYNKNKNNNKYIKEEEINENMKSSSPSDFSLFSDNK